MDIIEIIERLQHIQSILMNMEYDKISFYDDVSKKEILYQDRQAIIQAINKLNDIKIIKEIVDKH